VTRAERFLLLLLLACGGTSHPVASPRDETDWQREVAPVFDGTCKRCHLPAGSAKLDLSSAAAWLQHADSIKSVLIARSMPPEGPGLTDEQRAVLLGWLQSR